jgi:hypothetical protein
MITLLQSLTAALSLSLISPARSAAVATAASYNLAEDYNGDNFFSKFNFFTDNDPNHGFVE